jgi:hypothetical protein
LIKSIRLVDAIFTCNNFDFRWEFCWHLLHFFNLPVVSGREIQAFSWVRFEQK